MTHVSAVHVTVTGVLGGQITLPCVMRRDQLKVASHSKYLATSVSWTKRNRTVVKVTPGGILFMSHSAMSRARVYQSDIDNGIFSLRISNVREEDAGIYYGIASYGRSRVICTATLRTIQVLQSPQEDLLPENSKVTLTCVIGDPGQSLTSFSMFRWYHRGVPVAVSDRILMNRTSLHIRRLAQDDQGDWSCEVDGARASQRLSVVGISGPSRLSVYTPAGSSVPLPCNVTYLPSLAVQWNKATRLIPGDRQVLTLSHVSPEDAGVYRCNVTYGGQVMTRHITLKVIQVFPSTPTFVREGSFLNLVCDVTGADADEQYEWTAPGNSTEDQDKRTGATLSLASVSQRDSGMWICTVRGKDGSVGKVEHVIYVHAPQVAQLGSFSSWQTYFILFLALLLLLGLIVIAVVSVQNRQRRLSHLAALAAINPLAVTVKECKEVI
ncbi:lymphocyte activation gene 3 protein isoform X2 [Hyperolius riggenbachi]|uniref:lymphocyte activation gene 3 protein isoform X2 n=1 Tax=Hyperolius riggenbachi TaxID=752182 RepID=UPI0035A2F73D